jgi:chromosome condensin MukBEF ATPase and DNA-binding subunit MukB
VQTGISQRADNDWRSNRYVAYLGIEIVSDEKTKLAQCETRLSELDKTIKDFDSNEAPIKAQRETQRKKVAAIQKMITEMSVSSLRKA